MRTLFSFVLLLCLCSISSGKGCHRELLENIDFPGEDITYVYSPDVNHCQQLCSQHPQCQFFTFVRPDWTVDGRHFYCYLKKSNSGNPSRQKALLGLTSGYSLKTCPQYSDTCFHQMYTDIDFPGADYKSLFTADAEACQDACTHDLGCQFFTWVNDQYATEAIRYKCHLKFNWIVPLTPIVETKEGVVSGFSHKVKISTTHDYVLNECSTKYFPNTNIPGNDILSIPAASPEHCQIMCAAHPLCTSFTFSSSKCFLKKTANEMKTVALDGATSGLPSRFCDQDKSWLNNTYDGVDFRGSDITYILLDDPKSCQKTCIEDTDCQFFAYANEKFSDKAFHRRCYLKRTISFAAPPKVTKLTNGVSGFALRGCDFHML